MVDRPSEVDQVRLFIRNLRPTYRQHLWLTRFEIFITQRNIGTLVEELARKTPIMVTIRKTSTITRIKRLVDLCGKEVHAINRYTEYTPIKASYTQALE